MANRKTWIIILLVILIAVGLAILSFFLFRYFLPELPETHSETQEYVFVDDPDSTLYVSQNEGELWRGISDVRISVGLIHADVARSRFLVGATDNGLWYVDMKKTDVMREISSTAKLVDVESREQSKDIIAATLSNGRGYVVRMNDQNFEELFFAPLERDSVGTIAVDDFQQGVIYAGAGKELYISEDNGMTWRIFHQFRRKITQVILHPNVAGWCLVSLENGDLYRSSDFGSTWEEISKGLSRLKGSKKNQRIISVKSASAFYVTSDFGLLRSLDNASSWQDIPLLVPSGSLPIIGFAVHPNKPNTLFVSAANQLYKSEDGGRTWKGILFSEKSAINIISISPVHPYTLLVGFTRPRRF